MWADRRGISQWLNVHRLTPTVGTKLYQSYGLKAGHELNHGKGFGDADGKTLCGGGDGDSVMAMSQTGNDLRCGNKKARLGKPLAGRRHQQKF